MTRRPIVVDGIHRDDLTKKRLEQLRREWALPDGFRLLTAKQREESRRAALAPLAAGSDLWAFGCGSLMWNPAIHVTERCAGLVRGWHRRFCLWLPVGRGSPERPGLMLGSTAVARAAASPGVSPPARSTAKRASCGGAR